MLFDEQFVEQFGDVAIDVLRAIVGVKSLDDEREALQQRFEYGDEEGLANPFAGNVLTADADMWAYMQSHVQADPRLSLGGPSLHWLRMALADCAALARLPSPNLPCYTALGTQERVVATAPIHTRMARWPGAGFDIIAGAEHEVMMEIPTTRAQFFDAGAQKRVQTELQKNFTARVRELLKR